MSEAKKKAPKVKDAETLLVICKEKLRLACRLAERYRDLYVLSEIVSFGDGSGREENAARKSLAERLGKENKLPWESGK